MNPRVVGVVPLGWPVMNPRVVGVVPLGWVFTRGGRAVGRLCPVDCCGLGLAGNGGHEQGLRSGSWLIRRVYLGSDRQLGKLAMNERILCFWVRRSDSRIFESAGDSLVSTSCQRAHVLHRPAGPPITGPVRAE